MQCGQSAKHQHRQMNYYLHTRSQYDTLLLINLCSSVSLYECNASMRLFWLHTLTHTRAYVQTLESAWFWQSELSTSLSMRFRFRKYNRADAVHLLSLAWVDSFFDFQIGQLNRMNEIIFWMQYNSVMTRFRSSFHWLWCLFVNMNRTRLNPFVKYIYRPSEWY